MEYIAKIYLMKQTCKIEITYDKNGKKNNEKQKLC